MIRVVVTGSECTGKTTLAKALAAHYGTLWVPEFARQFVLDKTAPPDDGDVEPIARGQIEREREMAGRAERLLIHDTDLLSTVVYSEHYYGSCPEWIVSEVATQASRLYLLADIDIPWEPDGAQRDRGQRRDEMQALFRDALERFGLTFEDIRGEGDERTASAIRSIERHASAESSLAP